MGGMLTRTATDPRFRPVLLSRGGDGHEHPATTAFDALSEGWAFPGSQLKRTPDGAGRDA